MSSAARVFERVHPEYFPYYRSWCHDYPVLITRERDAEVKHLAKLLYRCCEYYVNHYKDYLDYISYEDEVMEILEYQSKFPYRAGTYRPDFVIDENGNIMLCEITSRFFGNGYFMSYFMEKAGETFAKEAGVSDYESYFDQFFDYMADMSKSYKRLVVLKSADKSDSIKLYVPFYEALGLETHVIDAPDIEDNLNLLDSSMIVSALNQKDILSLSVSTRHLLMDNKMRNDFRTVFLLHDKRFFYLFFKDEFTSKVLDDEETRFLRAHTIPTSISGENSEMWEDARLNKDKYIVKHHCLGKSEKVYAGCLTSKEEWDEIFASDDLSSMILQPFISQKRFVSKFKGEELTEYVSPSFFTIDDKYFGIGLFRTSSCPVINKGDAHKIAPVITDEVWKFEASKTIVL